VLTKKYFDGKVPPRHTLQDIDKKTLDNLRTFPGKISESIDRYRFREALGEMMNLARLGNKYLTDNEPWKIFKTDPERVETILNISLQITANLAIVAEPFLPFSAEKLLGMLNLKPQKWDVAGSANLLPEGHQLGKPAFLFEKIEDADVKNRFRSFWIPKKLTKLLRRPHRKKKKSLTTIL